MPKIPTRTNEKNGESVLRPLDGRIRGWEKIRALFHPVREEWLKKTLLGLLVMGILKGGHH